LASLLHKTSLCRVNFDENLKTRQRLTLKEFHFLAVNLIVLAKQSYHRYFDAETLDLFAQLDFDIIEH
jgi:hypothetical protein